jgi:hypothetical protein
MALKTFNVDEAVYKRFSEHCKKEGISMSKKVENFIKQELEKINLIGKTEKKSEDKVHPMHKYC